MFHPVPARKELSETCRFSCRNKFVKLVHLVGLITKKPTEVFWIFNIISSVGGVQACLAPSARSSTLRRQRNREQKFYFVGKKKKMISMHVLKLRRGSCVKVYWQNALHFDSDLSRELKVLELKVKRAIQPTRCKNIQPHQN